MIRLKNNPLVTVAMPVFNGSAYLAETIDSILNQTFFNFKFLIVDDGSIDNSIEVIKAYEDSRITLLHNETNLGAGAAMNKAITNANGKYIAIMNCDDISFPIRLGKQV